MIDPSKLVCGNCEHSMQRGGGPRECHRHPPQMAAVPVSGGIAAPPGVAGINWLAKALWPMVRDDDTCGDFETKVEIVN